MKYVILIPKKLDTEKKNQIERTMDEFTSTFKFHGRNIIAS